MSHHEHKPSVFLQLHLLVNHGPANPNRDDEGRPKIATVGGVERMRLSSQSIKRAVRMGEAFQEGLAEENLGKRTRRAGFAIQEALSQAGADEQAALCYATATARVFGHLDGSGAMPGNKQLAFITGSEMSQAKEVAVHAWRTATDRDASASDIINIPEQAVQEIAAAAKSLLGQEGKPLEKALDALNKGNPSSRRQAASTTASTRRSTSACSDACWPTSRTTTARRRCRWRMRSPPTRFASKTISTRRSTT